MKVTVCQFNPAEDTLDQALDKLSEHLVKHGSDFLLLPEMCFAPWLAADPVPDPQAWQAAVAMHEARIAGLRDLGVGTVVGTRPVIRENGSWRNQAYVWGSGEWQCGRVAREILPARRAGIFRA